MQVSMKSEKGYSALQRDYLTLICFSMFCILTSRGNANRVQCSINVNYQSLAGDELVLLQDKLLDPKTLLHSMTSANGRDRNLF